MSARVLQFKRDEVAELRQKLVEAVGEDSKLVSTIEKMSDEQVKAAFEKTQGSLMEFVDKIKRLDEDFARYMSEVAEREDSLLIINAAINYVVDFCSKVPRAPHEDMLDKAHKEVFKQEMRRYIEKTISAL